MTVVRRSDSDAYQHASAVAREMRTVVATQLHDLVIESERMGSRGELAQQIQNVAGVDRQLAQAIGRQVQAREMGLPLAPSVEAEREARGLLRSAVMALGASCATWAAAMDFEVAKAHDAALNGMRPREDDGGETGE